MNPTTVPIIPPTAVPAPGRTDPANAVVPPPILAPASAPARTAATVRELHFETGRYSLAEQMRTVAEGCTLLMGVHGAGLNLAIAMDPPVVLAVVGAKVGHTPPQTRVTHTRLSPPLTPRSQGIPNKNSPNLVTAAGGCYRRASILKEASHTIVPAELRSHAETAAAECGRLVIF